MRDFDTFCERYNYDPASDEAEREYAEYARQSEVMSAAFGSIMDRA